MNELDLRSSTISLLGGTFIQGLLVCNPYLTRLRLVHNEPGNMGVGALARNFAFVAIAFAILDAPSSTIGKKEIV